MEKETTKTRGRPTQSQEVFERHGEEAPVKEILEEAKISRGTFYKYFSSKLSLREALLRFATSRLLKSIEVAVEEENEAIKKLEAGINAYFELHMENPRVYRALLRLAITPGSVLYEIRSHSLNKAAELIAREVEKTGYQPTDPMLYQVLVRAMDQASVLLFEDNVEVRQEKLERAKKIMLRIMAAALGTEDTSLPPLPPPPE